ncbi:4-hydroxyproline epimerase [Mesorhizobium sp. M4B.F.Ca.ET.058.02.1.1]|uniref:4-hydroxyproline epimerase n=1 Tax=Mesorhizobium sp. M4B.F.Ca.ET.058.02.1.1 TaxID=2493675 RepID=UPI001FE17E37|nr:4-hydroxyproline epimerase [Mesorhizobium sp. M4B.F.Ca.ET.058.02.1.1]
MRRSFFCIDSHTCGNPVRLVAGGGPLLPHAPIAERRELFMRDHDWIRQALMFEPRGHDIMSARSSTRHIARTAISPSSSSRSAAACRCARTVTAAIEEGLVTPRVPDRLSIETPAGRVDIRYEKPGEFVDSVLMFNVASYLHAADVAVDVPGLGRLVVDIAYGGNFYAVVEPQESWRGIDGLSASDIVGLSRSLREALEPVCDPVHPDDERIRGVHHAIWCDKPSTRNADGRGAVFYGDKAIDRSPGGTGTSARMAQLHGKGRLKVGDIFRQESLIGTVFEGRVEAETDIGPFKGITPSVGGWARIIGHNTIFVDDRDPLAHGFQIA